MLAAHEWVDFMCGRRIGNPGIPCHTLIHDEAGEKVFSCDTCVSSHVRGGKEDVKNGFAENHNRNSAWS